MTTTHLDRDAIKGILPHRAPFLFVDAVTEVEPGKRIVGELHADRSKFFFERTELVPATLLAEAMAQVGAILVLYPEEHRGRTIYFRSIKACSFEAPIPIGSKVKIEAEVKKMRGCFEASNGPNRSRAPSGQYTIALSTLFASPSPKCTLGSWLDP